MITEKLMIPYVLSAQHKIVHLAMFCTQIIIYHFKNEENNKAYVNISFVDIFKSDLSPEEKILKCYFLMALVHKVACLIDFYIEYIEKKWENKSVSSAQSLFDDG